MGLVTRIPSSLQSLVCTVRVFQDFLLKHRGSEEQNGGNLLITNTETKVQTFPSEYHRIASPWPTKTSQKDLVLHLTRDIHQNWRKLKRPEFGQYKGKPHNDVPSSRLIDPWFQ